IHDRQVIFVTLLQVPVVVPAAEVNRTERAAGLGEPAGEQRALAPRVSAILVAELWILFRDVERLPGGCPEDELMRLLSEFVHRLRIGPVVELLPHHVESL